MNTVPCKGCGRPIVFAMGPNGLIPLDARAPVYRVMEGDDGELIAARVNEDQEGRCHHFVTHFSTCRDVAQFSRSKRAAPA